LGKKLVTPDDLKRLAGIVDRRGIPTHNEPINRSGITAKPGTDEWFKAMFPVNDTQMPVGFRGEKNETIVGIYKRFTPRM
jgi:hypothetical protein